MPSFDVVSEVDMQEVENAVNQTSKEIDTRYDLKGTKCRVELDKKASSITLHADDSMKLRSVTEVLNQKMVKRGIGVRALEYKDPEDASGGSLRQLLTVKQGISQDDARQMVKVIKDQKFKKVQAQIQGDQLRVSSPSKDELQQVIKLLKENAKLELQFVNFRD